MDRSGLEFTLAVGARGFNVTMEPWVVSTVADFYGNINPATLSGAIDVVVVEQESGELTCSPFHVRFGKLKLLRPVEKKVSISINGNPTNLAMKVGEAGEAFFVVEKGGGASLSSDFVTSPLTQGLPIPDEIIVDPLNLDEPATPASSPTLLPPGTMPSDLKLAAGLDRSVPSEADDSEPIDPSKFPGPSSPPNWSWTWGSLPVKSDKAEAAEATVASLGADDWDKLPSESTGITGAAVAGSALGEIGQRLDGLAISATPLDTPEAAPMGSLAAAGRPASVLSSALQAQPSLQADPITQQASTAAVSADMSVHEKVGTFFASLPAVADSSAAPHIPSLGVTPADTPVGSPSVPGIFEKAPENALEAASGLNAAASVPMSTPHPITRLELSLCGVSVLGALQREETAGTTEYSNAIDEFERQRITATAFEANPRILFDQNLVVRINDSFFNWATASVAVVSSLAFGRGANSPAMAALNIPAGGAGLLFPPSPPNIQRSSSQGESKRYSGFGFRQWWSRGPSSTPSAPGGDPNGAAQQAEAMGSPDVQAPAIRRQSILSLGIGPKPLNEPQPSANNAVAASPPLTPPISSSFVKSLRLTSDELKALNLKRGMNTVTFSVTSTLQGTATCSAKIYFWDYKTKVVISD
ncbi:Nuclear elongation and deformation protein 1, partial [Cladochytrium tenue]